MSSIATPPPDPTILIPDLDALPADAMIDGAALRACLRMQSASCTTYGRRRRAAPRRPTRHPGPVARARSASTSATRRPEPDGGQRDEHRPPRDVSLLLDAVGAATDGYISAADIGPEAEAALRRWLVPHGPAHSPYWPSCDVRALLAGVDDGARKHTDGR